jgi:PAS domain S-box-containing protein
MQDRRTPSSAPRFAPSALDGLLDASPAPMWICDDAAQQILAVNGRALEYFGCGAAEFREMWSAGIEAPAPFETEEAGGRVLRRRRKSDGTPIVMRLATSRIDVDGRPASLVIATDITRETQTTERFRQLFEIAADFYWEADTEARVTHISGDYEGVVGIPPAEALGKRLREVPGVSIAPEMSQMALQAILNRRSFRDLVYSRTLPNGEKRWLKLSAVPIFDADGTFRGARGVGAEITKHIEAEQAARLAQSRLHDAVAHVTQPLVLYDANDGAVAYNQAFVDLHRYPDLTQPVFQGVSFRALAERQLASGLFAAGENQPAATLESLLESYESGQERTYHLRDGRWMLVVYRPLPGGGRVGLWSDVTALKRAEAKRLVLEEQLHHSQRLEALGTLAGGVAHEINNALVPVLALTKVVAGKLPEDSRERRNLDTVAAAAARTRDLVRQILAFSRKEERRRETFDLAAVTHEALRLMRASLPATIRLDVAVEPVPPLTGDPNQLLQVVVNVVTNAAQAIGDAIGHVAVALRRDADGAHLRLSVTDSGCGMNEMVKARIFEPFFTTRDVGRGAGLGLAVAHGIVREHGGHIEVESAPGDGSRFDIVLPLSRAGSQAA